MTFDRPQTSQVETRKLRRVLAAIEEEELERAADLLKTILGLDQPRHEIMD